MSQPDLFRLPRKLWNAGRMTGAKAPLKPKHIRAIRQYLKSVGSIRDLVMFNLALDAKLRGCDLVKLRLGDIAQGGVIRQRSPIIQQKTGRPVPFEIGVDSAVRLAPANRLSPFFQMWLSRPVVEVRSWRICDAERCRGPCHEFSMGRFGHCMAG
ncbi:hypothetical protein [Brevundimonas nasdae]|uniref:hypothetical protein n=1 Tax=Brevundimonas nasdae TaxID=172043 RepID=UPI0030172FD9